MRTAFIQELIELAATNEKIFLVVGDLGYSVVETFAERFPDRFLNAGIAEQNMTGLAAGLASEGYHVFTYSIANFPTTRCLEQIRNDVCYHNLPVTIVAVGGGVAYGTLGYSHHAVQDYAFMRALPGMTILSPGDPLETKACLREVCDHPRPSYLRLGKNGETQILSSIPRYTDPEIAINYIAGNRESKQSLLTTGTMLETGLQVLDSLDQTTWSLWSVPIWSGRSGKAVRDFLSKRSRVVSLEEHLRAGGFGSFLRECVGNDNKLHSHLITHSLDDDIGGMVGSQAVLRELGGLSSVFICQKINYETELI